MRKADGLVLCDERQNVFYPEYQEGLEILLSYSSTGFELFVNCRNTVQIGIYSARMSGFDLGIFLKENGEEIRRIAYTDEGDFVKKIKEIINNLRREQVLPEDVVFLLPKRYENSLLRKTGIEVEVLGGDSQDGGGGLPVYATIQGFKGLDSKVAVLFGMEGIRNDIFSKYLHIVGTRAWCCMSWG